MGGLPVPVEARGPDLTALLNLPLWAPLAHVARHPPGAVSLTLGRPVDYNSSNLTCENQEFCLFDLLLVGFVHALDLFPHPCPKFHHPTYNYHNGECP